MQHLTSHDLGVAHAHLPLVIPWAFTWSKESAKPTAAWSFLRKECIGFILDKTCLDIYIYVYICQCKYIYTYSCTHANIACHVHMPGLLVCISTASSGFIGLLLLLRKPIPRVIANSLSNEWQPEGRYDAQGCEVYIYMCACLSWNIHAYTHALASAAFVWAMAHDLGVGSIKICPPPPLVAWRVAAAMRHFHQPDVVSVPVSPCQKSNIYIWT